VGQFEKSETDATFFKSPDNSGRPSLFVNHKLAELEVADFKQFKKMKICVIGGNGQVGQRCCRLGIGKGHTMTALVRDPNKISSELRALINIVQGDATDVKDVDLAVQGQDSVLCCLGEFVEYERPKVCKIFGQSDQ
jgi:hypothetical protein